MYRSPYVVGIDSALVMAQIDRPEYMMQLLGNNSGNIVFSEALYSCICKARRGNFLFHADDLDRHDCVVIAAANWLNSYDDFGWLADRLENFTLPVVIVGLGAQSSSIEEIPQLKPMSLRMLKIISERSAAISVRGEFSAKVLAHYGIKNIMITGCPSLLLCGSRGPRVRALHERDVRRCVIGSTRHLMFNADSFQLYLYHQAMKNDFYIVLQSELADYYLMEDEEKLNGAAENVLLEAYGVNSLAEVKRYLHSRGRFFLSLDEWIGFASQQSFCIGTRIHGAVVSLMAGTPATLIAHDTRTRELAAAMNIPYIDKSEVDTDKDISIEEMYSAEKISTFVNGYGAYRDNFRAFFAKNGLVPSQSWWEFGAWLSGKDERSSSGSEVNWLGKGLCHRRPAVDLSEHDLAGREQGPEQHRCRLGRG